LDSRGSSGGVAALYGFGQALRPGVFGLFAGHLGRNPGLLASLAGSGPLALAPLGGRLQEQYAIPGQ
uniref:hypothetical protein n=1 Tax=Vibrio sp. Vb0592 TaxID=2816072 RepID=UPI001F5DDBED